MMDTFDEASDQAWLLYQHLNYAQLYGGETPRIHLLKRDLAFCAYKNNNHDEVMTNTILMTIICKWLPFQVIINPSGTSEYPIMAWIKMIK